MALPNHPCSVPLLRSYKSDMETDPFGEKGSVWSFNYFFYNKASDALWILIRLHISSTMLAGHPKRFWV